MSRTKFKNKTEVIVTIVVVAIVAVIFVFWLNYVLFGKWGSPYTKQQTCPEFIGQMQAGGSPAPFATCGSQLTVALAFDTGCQVDVNKNDAGKACSDPQATQFVLLLLEDPMVNAVSMKGPRIDINFNANVSSTDIDAVSSYLSAFG